MKPKKTTPSPIKPAMKTAPLAKAPEVAQKPAPQPAPTASIATKTTKPAPKAAVPPITPPAAAKPAAKPVVPTAPAPPQAPKASVPAPAPTPAPAPKPKAVKPKTAAAKAPAVAPSAPATTAPLAPPQPKSSVESPAPTPITAAPAPVEPVLVSTAITTVEANIDIGYGNSLYIRGEGDSLSWDEGQPLQCEAPNKWVWSAKSGGDTLVFKILLNNEVWSVGEDWTVTPGEKIEVVPVF